jgi:hypothetical protein
MCRFVGTPEARGKRSMLIAWILLKSSHTLPGATYLEHQCCHRCPASLLGCRAEEIIKEFAFAVPLEVACRY